MTIDTKRLRRIAHAVGLECGHNTGKMIEEAADQIDAQAGEIAHLRDALASIIDIAARPAVIEIARASLSGESK